MTPDQITVVVPTRDRWAILRRTLDACGGNTAAAARELGIHRSTIYRRLHGRG